MCARLDLYTVYTAALCFHNVLYIRKLCVPGCIVATLDMKEKKRNIDKKPEYFCEFSDSGMFEMY